MIKETGTLAKDAPSGLQPREWVRPVLVSMAAAASLLVHAGFALALLDWVGRNAGAISEPSDAVSVELLATDTTEAPKTERTSEPAPSPETPASVAGSATPTKPDEAMDPPEKHETDERAEPVPEADDGETRDAERGEPSEAPAAPALPAAPAPEPPPEPVPKPAKSAARGEPAKAKAKKVEKTAAQPLGGIVSKAKSGKNAGSGRVSASTGSMLAYANLVRARVSPSRSNETGAAGTAVVGFGLTSTGALAYARIARSSGNATNDGIALAVVRGAAPFPTPPAGATPKQLQFTIPYEFR